LELSYDNYNHLQMRATASGPLLLKGLTTSTSGTSGIYDRGDDYQDGTVDGKSPLPPVKDKALRLKVRCRPIEPIEVNVSEDA